MTELSVVKDKLFYYLYTYANSRDPISIYDFTVNLKMKSNVDIELDFDNWPHSSIAPKYEDLIIITAETIDLHFYGEKRAQVYPTIGEQFDMLYHYIKDTNNDLKNSEWFVTIQNIKNTYPKP
jgi:hypothetical protein